jgi:hypothetical protein
MSPKPKRITYNLSFVHVALFSALQMVLIAAWAGAFWFSNYLLGWFKWPFGISHAVWIAWGNGLRDFHGPLSDQELGGMGFWIILLLLGLWAVFICFFGFLAGLPVFVAWEIGDGILTKKVSAYRRWREYRAAVEAAERASQAAVNKASRAVKKSSKKSS